MASVRPAFSIVIPLYNRSRVIERTIRSVLAQSFRDFEVIVVDDGSSDAPEPVIDAIGDPRIRYVRQANAGGGAARNRGIDEARGEYLALLDSDDLFLPEKLEVISRELPLGDKEVLYSSMLVDRGVGKFWVRPDRAIRPDEDVGEYLFLTYQMIQTSTIVMRADLAKAVKFDPMLPKGQDLDFCLRLQKHGAHFRMIETPLVIWTDATEAGRTSYVGGYQSVLTWLDRCSDLLTPRARIGYRATILAYYMGRHRPLVVARDLWAGLGAGVPINIIARQLLRAYLPRGYYRMLANTVVKWGGR